MAVAATARSRVPERRARWISVNPVRSASGSPGRRGVTGNGREGVVVVMVDRVGSLACDPRANGLPQVAVASSRARPEGAKGAQDAVLLGSGRARGDDLR